VKQAPSKPTTAKAAPKTK
jgi:hypothetical protein